MKLINQLMRLLEVNMSDYKITDLGEGFLLVQPYIWQKKEKVIVLITEAYEDGTTKVVSEKIEWREPKPLLGDFMYIFTQSQYDKMVENYKLGNCEITSNGLSRYSNANGFGANWYGQPAKTAKMMASAGVKLPKELFGLYSRILGEC